LYAKDDRNVLLGRVTCRPLLVDLAQNDCETRKHCERKHCGKLLCDLTRTSELVWSSRGRCCKLPAPLRLVRVPYKRVARAPGQRRNSQLTSYAQFSNLLPGSTCVCAPWESNEFQKTARDALAEHREHVNGSEIPRRIKRATEWSQRRHARRKEVGLHENVYVVQ
jgi:hypothetical protein